MNHFMRLEHEEFEKIKNKIKKIEVRINDEKRQIIKLNDEIEFESRKNNKKIKVKVIGLSYFKSFKELYQIFDSTLFGNDKNISLENQIKYVKKFYSETKEKEYGVIGIHIKNLKKYQ